MHAPPRRRIATLVLAALVAAAAVAPASAFTPRTRVVIVERAMTLMPLSLRRQMGKHKRALLEGALDGLRDGEGAGAHAYLPGTADAELARSVEALTNAVGQKETMREIVRRFGRTSHAAADLAFSLNVGPNDPREQGFYEGFARYVEEQLPRMRITFDGFADEHLRRGDVRAFAAQIAETARADYDGIVLSYHPEGRQPVSQDFDERSVAFATASLEVSLAVTATARAWLYAWHAANGDLGGMPLIESAGAADPFAPPPVTLTLEDVARVDDESEDDEEER